MIMSKKYFYIYLTKICSYKMKHFSDYILEKQSLNIVPILEDADGNIIEEGFWKKLGKLFGFGTEKVKQTMKSWNKELRDAYVAGQIAAAKSKDSKTKESIKKQDAAAEKSAKDLLAETKLEVQRLMKNWDAIEMVDYVFAQYKQLFLLSEQEKDEDGKKLSEKFKKLIDNKFPDGGKNYEQTVEKIEKSGVSKVEGEGEREEATEVTGEDVKTAISNNKQLLEPLVKAMNGKVTGEQLASMVEKLMHENPEYKSKSKAAETSNIIGMAAIISGAMIMTSGKCINRSIDWVKDNIDKIKKYVPAEKQKLNVPKEK